MKRALMVTVMGAVLLTCGCSHTGLSRKFHSAAQDALDTIRAAERDGGSGLAEVDKAVTAAKAVAQTSDDLQTADALDWYAILLHRLNRDRTAAWRSICDTELDMRLRGQPTSRARLDNGAEVPVQRGDCQAAAFRMMAQDANWRQ